MSEAAAAAAAGGGYPFAFSSPRLPGAAAASAAETEVTVYMLCFLGPGEA